MHPDVVATYTSDIAARVAADAGFSNPEDLGGFENLVFADESRILRVTHCSHRSAEQLLGEVEFVRFLAEHGCRVAAPLAFADGSFVHKFGDFFSMVFERAPGTRLIGAADLVAEQWGEAIGRFHRLAQVFDGHHRRPSWRDDPNHDFVARIPGEQAQILALAADTMKALAALPEDRASYGLIHGDAHPGNFLVEEDCPTFFDFDDAIYAWFSYDIATILFSVVLAEHVPTDRREQAAEVTRFLRQFLAGYGREATVTREMAAQLPLMIRLRELSLYAVVHEMMDVDNLTESYPRRFMAGRRSSMEQGIPFVDVDFDAVLAPFY